MNFHQGFSMCDRNCYSDDFFRRKWYPKNCQISKRDSNHPIILKYVPAANIAYDHPFVMNHAIPKHNKKWGFNKNSIIFTNVSLRNESTLFLSAHNDVSFRLSRIRTNRTLVTFKLGFEFDVVSNIILWPCINRIWFKHMCQYNCLGFFLVRLQNIIVVLHTKM